MGYYPPEKDKSVYDHQKVKCENCEDVTLHRFFVEWGDKIYQQTKTCLRCNKPTTKQITKEECEKLEPRAKNAS